MESLVYWVGVASLAYIAVALASFLKKSFIVRNDLAKYKFVEKADGSGREEGWAVVTGASDGIGKALATEIARRGVNVVLVSRTKAKLEDVAAEIAAEVGPKGGKSAVLVMDFAAADEAAYAKLFRELDRFAITMLVNNVGVSTERLTLFEDSDAAELLRMKKVNMEAQTRMTLYVLRQMKSRRCGAIIDLSSISAVGSLPVLSCYAATKAYNLCLSRAIAAEVHYDGVEVLAVTPSAVATKLSRQKKENFFVVLANDMARQTLNKLGHYRTTCGHWRHDLILPLFGMLPHFLHEPLHRKIFVSLMVSQQRAFERKRAKEEAARAEQKQ